MAPAVTTPPWIIEGRKYLGLHEIKGAKNNPTIVAWGKAAGIDWWNNDEDAWCAVFVGGILAAVGLPTTREALARSYLDYGIKLDKGHPVVGAIVVFPRGNSQSLGHVGFVAEVNDTNIKVLNGNVSDEVRYSTFTRASILGLSWPASVALPEGAVRVGGAASVKDDGVLRLGDSGPLVMAMQKDMNVLGYKLAENGTYDAATFEAVKAFQSRREMTVDGEAGPATRAALDASVTAKKAQTQPLPGNSVLKSGTLKAAVGTVAAGAAGIAEKAVNGDTISDTVDTAKEVAGVVKDNHDYWAAGTAFGYAVFAAAVAYGLYLIWKRLRDAGKLPTWLGGKKVHDDVPEAVPPASAPPPAPEEPADTASPADGEAPPASPVAPDHVAAAKSKARVRRAVVGALREAAQSKPPAKAKAPAKPVRRPRRAAAS